MATASPDLTAARRARYGAVNTATLRWMLDRPRLGPGFLDTKVNSLSGADYGDADGWRGPAFTYGWIQGRGLEALATHAAFLEAEDRALADLLDTAGRALFAALGALFARHGGHAYFCYDAAMSPIARGADGRAVAQREAGDLFTFSDAFAIKGLIAAASRYGDARALATYRARMRDLVAAIEDNRFCHDELQPFNVGRDPTRGDEFGPWMITLGAAGLLRRLGLHEDARFGARFVETAMARFWRGRDDGGFMVDRVGGMTANPGHAIEFVGFALEAEGDSLDAATRADLIGVLAASFRAGRRAPGIVTSIDADTGAHLSTKRPWWSLPESIRAAALAMERAPSSALGEIWRTAEADFLDHYWRGDPPFAWQTRDDSGPVDFVPATPDLDPGYHTGLSLLGAIEAMDRMTGAARRKERKAS